MKRYVWLISVIAVLGLVFCGCGKKKDVDVTKLQKSFQSADQSTQTTVNDAIMNIQTEEWPAALTQLEKLASNAKLTPEQKQAVKDAIEQVKNKAAAAVKDTANKAVDNLQKNLPK